LNSRKKRLNCTTQNQEWIRKHIDDFLETRGLEVKEAKTKVVNSTDGFEFLGWDFIVKPNGKFISTPSQKSTRSIKTKVKEVMKDSRYTLEQRIDKCGTKVRGWRNYHRFCNMSQHDLWATAYWTWKFIRKQGRFDRNQTNIAELHHIDGNHENWKSSNLEVLHRECHQHQTNHGRVRVRTAE
jgi:5-methylcytosine-specific restriction endonuclease McrA